MLQNILPTFPFSLAESLLPSVPTCSRTLPHLCSPLSAALDRRPQVLEFLHRLALPSLQLHPSTRLPLIHTPGIPFSVRLTFVPLLCATYLRLSRFSSTCSPCSHNRSQCHLQNISVREDPCLNSSVSLSVTVANKLTSPRSHNSHTLPTALEFLLFSLFCNWNIVNSNVTSIIALKSHFIDKYSVQELLYNLK